MEKVARVEKEVKTLIKKTVLVQVVQVELVQEILQEVVAEVDVDLLLANRQLRHQIQRSTLRLRKLEVVLQAVRNQQLHRMNKRRQMPQLQQQRQRRRLRMPKRRLSY